MKRILSVLLFVSLLLCLSGCSYDPPDGWTKKHHTYEEALAFAKSLDPNATVSREYTDTVDENDWQFRQWDAVINGVDCHVASVSDWVWNEGLAAGEFVKVYYRMDTDYDYVVLQSILADQYTNWQVEEALRNHYHHNTNTIFSELILPENKMLSDDALAEIWQTALEINTAYTQQAIERKAGFSIPAPGEYYDQAKNEHFIKMDAHVCIEDFTEEGKVTFLQEYKEAWALLESGLPIREAA